MSSLYPYDNTPTKFPPSPYRAPLNSAQTLNILLGIIILAQAIVIGILATRI